MLLEASCSIAMSAGMTTLVARSAGTQKRVTEQFRDNRRWELLLLDWKWPEMFLDTLESHLEKLVAVDLVLGWFHDPDFAPKLGARIPARNGCKFVHVIGSASQNPADLAIRSAEQFAHLPHLDYRQVLLGYVSDGAKRRWLTDSEIASGALEALASNSRQVIVGQIANWELRP